MAERTASPNAERDYHMELRDLLGEDYREGMTAEEIATALSTKNFVNKETFDKTASDLAKAKKDMKTNEGTLTERLEAQRQQIEQLTVKANRQEAASILAGNGMAKEAYDTFLDGIVTTDAEQTTSVATAIAAAFKAYGEATANKVKGELAAGVKAPSQAPAETAMTKEAFGKLTFAEQVQFKNDNPTEYAALFPKA